MAQIINDPNGGINSGGKPIDWKEISKNILNNQGFPDNSNIKYTPEPVRNAPIKLEKIGDVLTAEDKFYEKLGIKYHNTHMFGRPSRTKGRLLVAVVLVAGYFAYKKFKK